MKRILFAAFAFLVAHASFAQSQNFYTSTNYDKAIKAETRSISGLVGDNYWQNTSSYRINVKIDPIKGELIAFQTITYTNNSPNSLSNIRLNVFHNIYKKGAIRSVEIDPSDLHDGNQVRNVMRDNRLFNDSDIKWKGTSMYLPLKNKLRSGQTAKFTMDWSFKLPQKTMLHMGKYNNDAIFLGLWFPKIAVYDDIDSWSRFLNKEQDKFYSDYSDYEVTIEVPENYIVHATGELTNASSVLHPQILKRLKKSMLTNNSVHIVSLRDRIVTRKGKQTWRFKATNVNDFSFEISHHHKWDSASDNSIKKETKKTTFFPLDMRYLSLASHKNDIALKLFKNHLGSNVYRSTMNAFTKEWKSKHPTIYDFFAFVNDYLKTDFTWYWNKWFFSMGKADLAIQKIIKEDDSYTFIINNIGGLPLPIDLNIEYTDGSKENLTYKMDVWKEGQKALSINHYKNKAIKSVNLGNTDIPDIDMTNNSKTL